MKAQGDTRVPDSGTARQEEQQFLIGFLELRQVTNRVVPHSVWAGATFTFCSMRIGRMEVRSNLPIIVTNPSRGRYCGVSIPPRSLLNVTVTLDQADPSWNLLLAELSRRRVPCLTFSRRYGRIKLLTHVLFSDN